MRKNIKNIQNISLTNILEVLLRFIQR